MLSVDNTQQKSQSPNDSSALDITISINGYYFKVNKFNSLNHIFDCNQIKFLFKDIMICPALSFAYYDIKTGDQITAVQENVKKDLKNGSNLCNEKLLGKVGSLKRKHDIKSSPNMKFIEDRFIQKFADKFTDPDVVLERIQKAIDPNTSFECAHMNDVYKMKVESNPKLYRKVISSFQKENEESQADEK